MDGQAAAAPPALERSDGAAEIGFRREGAVTRIAHLYQRSPCRVLAPRAEPGEPVEAVVVTTSGGLADGDRLRLAITAEEGISAQVTTQAAEKVYRAARGDVARFDCDVRVGPQAWLEWLPQETILFDRSRFARRSRADVATGGRLLACEHVVFGRVARGESFARGFLFDRWDILRDGRLQWCDALCLDDDIAATIAAPWGFGGAEAMASAFYVADDAPAWRTLARETLDLWASHDVRGGVTVVNGILLVRCLGGTLAVRRVLGGIVAALRAAAGGWRAAPPRFWIP